MSHNRFPAHAPPSGGYWIDLPSGTQAYVLSDAEARAVEEALQQPRGYGASIGPDHIEAHGADAGGAAGVAMAIGGTAVAAAAGIALATTKDSDQRDAALFAFFLGALFAAGGAAVASSAPAPRLPPGGW
jgi:hypothetical protein